MTDLRAWLVDAATSGDWQMWTILALLALLVGASARGGFWRVAGTLVGVVLSTVSAVSWLVASGTVVVA